MKHFRIVSLMICFPLWSDKVMISLTLVGDKDVMLFQHCQQALSSAVPGVKDRRHSEANLSVKKHVFVSMTS
jgi:hypothetical protein